MPNDTKPVVVNDDILAPNINPVVATTPPPAPSQSSVAPTNDILNPTSNMTFDNNNQFPKKKFAGGKVIATILGLFLLVGGVGAGLFLVQQNQNPSEQAAGSTTCRTESSCRRAPCPAGYTTGQAGCNGNPDNVTCSRIVCSNATPNPGTECDPGTTVNCTVAGCPGTKTCNGSGQFGACQDKTGDNCPAVPTPTPTPVVPLGCVGYTSFGGVDEDTANQACLSHCVPNWNNLTAAEKQALVATGCHSVYGSLCQTTNNQGIYYRCMTGTIVTPVPTRKPPTVTPPPPTPTVPPITAQCRGIVAYTENWTALSGSQLSQLKAGNKVNFCVTGAATGGSFDKARFTINTVLQPETSTKRPSSEDYCQLYTIPATVSVFNVTAQIHHITLGWK